MAIVSNPPYASFRNDDADEMTKLSSEPPHTMTKQLAHRVGGKLLRARVLRRDDMCKISRVMHAAMLYSVEIHTFRLAVTATMRGDG
jgi:hypothetical protein